MVLQLGKMIKINGQRALYCGKVKTRNLGWKRILYFLDREKYKVQYVGSDFLKNKVVKDTGYINKEFAKEQNVLARQREGTHEWEAE